MPGTNNAFLKFSGVQKTYDGETLVIKNLNLNIAGGEFGTVRLRRRRPS
ncbi:ABC-type Fe3+/spermidine/putrescine transport system ATPase subunit [Bradyrhizobium japonicum]